MKSKTFIALLSMLLLGVMIGALLFGFYSRNKVRPDSPPIQGKMMKNRLMKVLQPTDVQSEKINLIVDKHLEEIEKIHIESRSIVDKKVSEMTNEIKQELDEKQLIRFEKVLEKRKERKEMERKKQLQRMKRLNR